MPTAPDPEPPRPGPDPEPVRVLRLRRFDALADLMREMRPEPVTYEPLGTAPGPHRAPTGDRLTAEEETQELPAVPAARARTAPTTPARGTGSRRAVVALAMVAAALTGFGGALLLPTRQEAAAAPPSAAPTRTPPPSTPAPTTPSASSATVDPDGRGTLRQGDTGPAVHDLQERLLGVPDVYRGGSASGTYDATLTEAVARFQLWYGVSGDERGVYGDDTRRALESRSRPDDDDS
ncbi:peptidoglycan-binding protein [Streptomyces sp. NPDC051452]|uniref:peptidoglycan-binding protein n=1 Tax=Streptomyces sp. NPDC051452 TaxID=3365654 RepID=UPI00379B49C4